MVAVASVTSMAAVPTLAVTLIAAHHRSFRRLGRFQLYPQGVYSARHADSLAPKATASRACAKMATVPPSENQAAGAGRVEA